jgi:hypothetical protein
MDGFYKNLSIMGGFLLLHITGAGQYSIDALCGIAAPLRFCVFSCKSNSSLLKPRRQTYSGEQMKCHIRIGVVDEPSTSRPANLSDAAAG